MNRKFVLHAALASIVLCSLFQNCSQFHASAGADVDANASTSATDKNLIAFTAQAATPAPTHLGRLGLEQFGFWGSAMDGINQEDSYQSVITNLANGSNVVFVSAFDPTTLDVSLPLVAQKISYARDRGLGVVLVVQAVYFQWGSLKLMNDAQTRFQNLWNGLGDLRSSVRAFYVYDEPYGHNALAGSEQIYWGFVRDNLNAVANHLKTMAPGIPSVVVFGADEIGYSHFFADMIPASISWIGFDCYAMEGDRCSDAAVTNYFQKFQTVAAANNQGIVLVPDAFSTLNPATAGSALVADQAKTLSRLRLYKKFAGTSWAIKAIYPWIYQNVTEAGQTIYWGAKNLPDVKNEYQILFDVLAGKAHCDSNQNLVYTNGASWNKAPACAPVCEAGTLVYRDVDGAYYASGGACQ